MLYASPYKLFYCVEKKKTRAIIGILEHCPLLTHVDTGLQFMGTFLHYQLNRITRQSDEQCHELLSLIEVISDHIFR